MNNLLFNWKTTRLFIEEALRHYSQAPGWFTDWLEDLYIRLEGDWRTITLDEIQSLSMLFSEGV